MGNPPEATVEYHRSRKLGIFRCGHSRQDIREHVFYLRQAGRCRSTACDSRKPRGTCYAHPAELLLLMPMEKLRMRHLIVIVLFFSMIACATTSNNSQTAAEAPSGITVPIPIHKVDPDYPPELRRQGVTGVVTVAGVIDKVGQLVNPRVVSNSDPRLNALALAAIRKWQFKPGTLDGVPVDVLYQTKITFSIP